jgi:hypothetical protein
MDFARKTFTYPVLLDADPVFRQYGVQGIPATLMVDRQGKVVNRHVGFSPGMETTLEEELKQLLTPNTTSR